MGCRRRERAGQYRLLSARGKHVNQVVVAIAREMAAFAWAIADRVVTGSRRASDGAHQR